MSRKSSNAEVQLTGEAEVQPGEMLNGQQGDQADVQQDDQPEMQQADQAALQQDGRVEKEVPTWFGRPSPRPARRRRPAAAPPEPLQLDPEFVNNPTRMQYALLLALLLRQKNGSATFSQRDMGHTDTDYNILFARTLDGKSLEVTVVSSESGIIRSPEKEREAEKWRFQQTEMAMRELTYQQLPQGSTSSSTPSIVGLSTPRTEADFQSLRIGRNPGGGLPTEMAGFLQTPPGANPGSGFGIPPLPGKTAEVIQLPRPNPTEAEGTTSYHFPFQVGDNPQTAVGPNPPMDLDRMAQQLLQKDQELAQQEQEAVTRQERGE